MAVKEIKRIVPWQEIKKDWYAAEGIDDSHIGDVYLLRQRVLKLQGILGAEGKRWYYLHTLTAYPTTKELTEYYQSTSAMHHASLEVPSPKADPVVITFLGMLTINNYALYKVLHAGLIKYGLAEEMHECMELQKS
jgi:hypothetical protein